MMDPTAVPHPSVAKVAQKDHTGCLIQLREHMSDALSSKLDDPTCLRFLKAFQGDVPAAAEALKYTSAWREKMLPEKQVCTACQVNPLSHYCHVVGYAKGNKPVLYMTPHLMHNRKPSLIQEHMIATFEQAVRCMPDGVQDWVAISDMYGFGIADLAPGPARVFNRIATDHYAERLHKMLIIDPPFVFYRLWQLMQPFIDPQTKKKLALVPYDLGESSKLRVALTGLFDQEMYDWLIKELAQVRQKGSRGKYFYSLPDLLVAVQSQEGPWMHQWGTESFRNKLRKSPRLLLAEDQELPTHSDLTMCSKKVADQGCC